MLVDRELTEREDHRLQRYLKAAKLRSDGVVEDIDFRRRRGLERPEIPCPSGCSVQAPPGTAGRRRERRVVGRPTVKVVVPSALAAAPTDPPIALRRLRTMCSPRPIPGAPPLWSGSPRRNASKICQEARAAVADPRRLP